MIPACPTCHGLVMEPGKVYGYAGPICRCAYGPLVFGPPPTPRPLPATLPAAMPQYGWLCPRCGAAHAPFVKRCTCTAEPAK